MRRFIKGFFNRRYERSGKREIKKGKDNKERAEGSEKRRKRRTRKKGMGRKKEKSFGKSLKKNHVLFLNF
jgi:hypothetical protein